MDCDGCRQEYNKQERIPKIVPCGHTVCLQCLQQSGKRECPSCKQEFLVTPASLLNSLSLLRQLDRHGDVRVPRGWCLDCRNTATSQCWDEHEVLTVKAALRRYLKAGVVRQAAEQLEALRRECQEEETLLTLLATESWTMVLLGGDHELTGTLRNTDDPLTKAMWLVLAEKFHLTKVRAAPPGPPPAAAEMPVPAPPEPTEAAAKPRPALREMVAGYLGRPNSAETEEEKAALLREAPGVGRLDKLWCGEDTAWALKLLECAAPTVERLCVFNANEAHLRTIVGMPRLRRLHLSTTVEVLQSPVLAALPPVESGLQWLSAARLPRATLQSLLQAHAHSLQELSVEVCDEGAPHLSLAQLQSVLERCSLRALRRLVLRRRNFNCTKREKCESLRDSLFRSMLPKTDVLCRKCDSVELDDA